MTRNTLKTFVALILALTMLAACGGGDDDADSTSDAEVTTTVADSPATDDPSDAAPDDVADDIADDVPPADGSIDDALGQMPLQQRIEIAAGQLNDVDRVTTDGTHADIYYSAANDMTTTMDCMIISMSVLLEGETVTLHLPGQDPHDCE